MATAHAASWAASLTMSQLPPAVVRAAMESLYNYIGCAIGGASHPTTAAARSALAPLFGASTSTLLGQDAKADAAHAALLNGIAAHVHDYDDTHLATIVHPTAPVASALLAQAEALGPGISGERLLVALVAGIEVECKLALGVWPAHYDVGWHITGTVGAIGAAAAVGRLLDLSPVQMEHALGIAASQVTGLRVMFGSDTKAFHVGRAAQNGLLAALLAQKGFTAAPGALEASRGWAAVVDAITPAAPQNIAAQIHTLGHTWEITANAFKPFPCGIVVHPTLDACLRLHDSAAAITAVHVRVHPLVLELTGKTAPADGLQAKFSVFHAAAAALRSGAAGPAQFADAFVVRPDVVALRGKVTATADAGLAADAAEVVLTLADGAERRVFVEHAIGSTAVPMDAAALEAKFLGQVTPVLGAAAAARASAMAWGALESTDVAQWAAGLSE
ncbi:2-methylcitrate dehydratase [Mycena indigotica]|uniref:2-methylcitrate dehydratase n=1 Tax=Mycena indigotica TaxID=2126181 RepID=A0A8H6W660_9AGAR|nr:2-methylcitrate dehydratase [Mycena indigotica]KAF7306362.1 2-methylcitrate dehydratase [Mycena indigotica]